MPGPRISQLDRDRLITAYEEGRDFIELAEVLSINLRSAYRIIRQYKNTNRRHPLPSGGPPPKKLDDNMVTSLVDYIAMKPTATLEEMRVFLMEQNPGINISTTTIMRRLDGKLITLKLTRTVPFEWNSEDVKNERHEYAQWMMNTGVVSNLVYTDEGGFNVWTARNQGRSVRGERAVRMVDGQRGRNLTVCLAVSPQYGLVHHVFVEGGMTKETYSSFMSKVSALLDENEVTVIQDNAPSHRDTPAFNEQHVVRSLPRYSPFLNITEMAISSLKSAVKRNLSSLETQRSFSDRERARQEGITLQKMRLNILKKEIEENIDVITRDKCLKWFGHSQTYMDRCLQKIDIFS